MFFSGSLPDVNIVPDNQVMQKLINPVIGLGNSSQTQQCSHPSASCPQCISINETNHQSVVALDNHPCTCSQLLSCLQPCTSTSCPITCNEMSYACSVQSNCGFDPGETYICSAFNPRCFVIQKVGEKFQRIDYVFVHIPPIFSYILSANCSKSGRYLVSYFSPPHLTRY